MSLTDPKVSASLVDMTYSVAFTAHELRLIPIEDLWQHVAMLKESYVADATLWIDHRDTPRVDVKFASYQEALDVLKDRADMKSDPIAVQDRLDKIRESF